MNNNSSHPVITRNNKCLNCKGKGNVNVTNISLQSMFKMSTSCFNTCLKPFAKWQYCFINWALWQLRPDRLQDGLQLRNVRWLRYIALILVKHRTPHIIVKRVEIRRIRWPLFLPDKLWAISAKPVLRQWRCEQLQNCPFSVQTAITSVSCGWYERNFQKIQ